MTNFCNTCDKSFETNNFHDSICFSCDQKMSKTKHIKTEEDFIEEILTVWCDDIDINSLLEFYKEAQFKYLISLDNDKILKIYNHDVLKKYGEL